MAGLSEIINRSKTTPPPSQTAPVRTQTAQPTSALSNIIQRAKSPALPPPPSPREVGVRQHESITSDIQSRMPPAIGGLKGAISTPDPRMPPLTPASERPWFQGGETDTTPISQRLGVGGIPGKAIDIALPAGIPPDPADLIMPLGGAGGRAAKGAGNWLRRRFGAGGYEAIEGATQTGAEQAARQAAKPAERLALSPSPTAEKFPVSTAPSTAVPPAETKAATVYLSPESAASSYPANKRLARKITGDRVRESEIQRELTTLSQSAPTPDNLARAEKLTAELDSLSQSRAKRNLTAADEDEIVSTVERMERDLPQAELGAAQYAAKPAKARGMTRRQAAESIGESVRGPEFAPPLKPKPPTGGVSKLPGSLREPPPPKTPERFTTTGEPRPPETVKSPPLRSPLYRPQTVLRKIGGAASGLADDIERGLAEGRLAGARRFYRLRKEGLIDLTPDEAVNVADILQTGGKAQPVTERAQRVSTEARKVLDEIAQEAGGATPEGTPLMVRGADGSTQIFTPRQNYFPHHIPPQHILSDSKNSMRRAILDDAVRRGDFDSLDEATSALDDYVQFLDKKTDRPKTLLSYFKRKNPTMGERDILRLLDQMRTPPSKYGALEQHRALDLPFYDPNAGRALDYYVKHASRRLALTRELGQQGEKINDALRRINKSRVEGSYSPDQVAKKVNEEVDKLLGQVKHDRDADAWGALFRTWQAFKIGPLTAVPNMFQDTLFGLLKTDFPTVMKGIGRTLTKEGRERAYSAGADMEQAIRLARMESGQEEVSYLSSRARQMQPANLREGAKKAIYSTGGKLQEVMGKVLTPYMRWNAFAKSELWQRAIGHNIGEAWTEKMSGRLLHNPNDKLATDTLRELGLDPARIAAQGGKLSDKDALMAGMRMSDILNFSNRPEDIASGFQGPFGRVVWQFKTFMYGATRLSYEGTVKEFQKGNYRRGMRNLMHMAVAFPMAGEAVAVTRELIRDPQNFQESMKERYGKDWRDNPLGQYFKNMGEMGAYAMLASTMQSAGYGKTVEGAAGPVITATGELAEAATRAGMKAPEDPEAAIKIMLRWGLRHGPLSATLVYPYVKEQLNIREEGSGRQGRGGRGEGRGGR